MDITPEEQEIQDGSPAHVQRPFIDIKFQLGPVTEFGVNGCHNEDVLDVIVKRLLGFQSGPFACRENALALTKLEEAKMWLEERTRRRQRQGIEGTNTADPPAIPGSRIQ